MIQVYGRFDGYWSHAQVSRGLVAGLYRCGLQDLQVCNVVDPNGRYEGLSEDLRDGGYGVSVASGPGDAPIGIWVGGYPPQMSNWLEGHRVRIAMFITESSVVPREWGWRANHCHLVIVPSQWVADAYARAGVDRGKLVIVPHGIHPLYCYSQAQPPTEPPRLLHVCGSASFPQRKGTPQLVEAFAKVFEPGEATLYVRLMPGGQEVERAAEGKPQVVLEHGVTALPPLAMIALQCGGGFSACVQPSRGEAFGIVPVETRAVGLPCIVTHCAGHVEHASPGDIIVRHGIDAPIRTNGIPNGAAPSVSVADIAEALVDWKKMRPRIQQGGSEYARRWQWTEVVRPLAARLKQIILGFTGPRRLDNI